MRPFANGTEFEYWVADNCSRGRGCVSDGTYGGGAQYAYCPLIDLAYAEEWPKEWPVVNGIFPGECTEYVEVEDE